MAKERLMPASALLLPHQTAAVGKPESSNLTGIVIVAVVVICALHFGSEVLIPITFAVLLSFLLSPLMELLRRLWLPRAVAAILAVLIAIGVIISLSGIIGTQIADLAGQVPKYEATIEVKVAALQRLVQTDLSGRLNRLMHKLETGGLARQQTAAQPAQQLKSAGTANQSAGPKPIPVVITHTPASSALELSRSILTPILRPIATLGIVLVVAIFTLLQKEDLRDRLIRLFGSDDLHRTTAAMDDAGRRLTRYFVTQLAINCSFGIVVGAGLSLIGVPSPVLWGILGALLRFVPYIGSYIAAALPVLLAMAVGHGWSMALWTLVLFVGTELVLGNAVEPVVYGHRIGLSPIAVIIAAIFWTWLWGPIGLVLSTPLTLCLAVLGRHIEQLEFLDVILGDRPALTPSENFYQRVLAGDPDEVEEQAERFLAERSLSAYYDEVALAGLQLAAADANRGVLAPQEIERVNLTVQELVRDLADQADVGPISERYETAGSRETPGEPIMAIRAATEREAAAQPRGTQSETKILCIAGRGPLDEAASIMLAQLLEKHGVAVQTAAHEAVSRVHIATLDAPEVAVVCVSYLDISRSSAHLRFLVRRIKQRLPNAMVLIGFWADGDPFLRDQVARRAAGADYYVNSLREALSICLNATHDLAAAPPLDRTQPALMRPIGAEVSQ